MVKLSEHLVKADEVAITEGVLHVVKTTGPIKAGFALEEPVPLLVQWGMFAPHVGDNNGHDVRAEDLDFEATMGDPAEFEEARAGFNAVLSGSQHV